MFQTGMERSVAVKQSSIAKARPVLGDVEVCSLMQRMQADPGLVCYQNPLESVDSSENDNDSLNHLKKSLNVALIDITNRTSTNHIDNKRYFGEKRRNGRINSVSPFKKPRSPFTDPLNTKNNSVPTD